MSRFVLVHGAWHGAWCWSRLAPLLEGMGHEVVAFDLPGHGDDATDVHDVSLQAYTDRIVRELDRSEEPAVLVAHSMGGVPATQAAGARPEAVAKLVYLTAFLLREGQTLLDVAGADEEALVIPNLEFTEDQSAATVKEEVIREAFYADLSEEDFRWATERLVPQAAAPFATPVRIPEGFARVPKAYVECARDRAISLPVHLALHSSAGVGEVVTLETDHSPFLSAPEALARELDRLAR
ncbi:Alpha/beta hydrolase family [Rubrobacter radiotolerans]|uniref:Alpha/beta fold hydrolase n=1 Tax=Rubrobacter radiotolerans TaxID=42256 RepID=A0A023X0Y2_RUBRA|nr:alpha/beta fold hydrolase [Rubrobacter radiotolerans]AHY45724.1 Alpha/beta hydrolase family [Rubrobacter radiotolerans]MDX5893140.1 alpha/beta fold hydrolase [Rubrobacter radiotolerans]SMC03133.1 Lysophospholipase, alpha-beta hydrolase superfamily [Rubrobacter radiotolerans DSM 5868]